MEPLLKVSHLEVSFHTYAGEVQAVRDISFEVKQGETVAIVGESGCGKSVTARAITGLIQTPPGKIGADCKIEMQGKNVLQFSEAEWKHYRGGVCSMIFQDAMAALNPTIEIGKQISENILNHQKVTKGQAWERSTQMLQLVGMADPARVMKKYPHELSGGMRQRVMIAMALACDPKLLVADEPTTALDVTIQAQIMQLMASLQKKMGTSIILITHDMGVVADVAHRVVVMYSGEIVETGMLKDIFSHTRHPYTWALLKAVPRLDQEEETLYSIEGAPPNLLNPPQGCPFAERCDYCMKICRTKKPPRYLFEESHEASCWLHDPRAATGGIPFEIGGELLG